MRIHIYTLVAFVSLVITPVSPVLAMAQQEASRESLVRVGVFEAPPFSVKNNKGDWEGLGIELWQRVADELGLLSEVQGYEELLKLRRALTAGEIDVILTIPATQEYETLMDLTQPYYRSGWGIAVNADAFGGHWMRFLSGTSLTSIAFIFIGLAGLWIIAGTAIYLLERRRNPKMFGGSWLNGAGQGVWWAAVTMTTVGYGDKAPLTPGGRVVAVIWMFASIVLISSLTASISASLTTEKLQGKVRGPQDLPHVRVGSIRDSRPLQWLAENGATASPYEVIGAGLDAIVRNEIDAFVFDIAVLKYVVNSDFAGRIAVLPRTVEPYYVGMGVANNNKLREAIDRSLLGVIAGEEWRRLLAQYGLQEQ